MLPEQVQLQIHEEMKYRGCKSKVSYRDREHALENCPRMQRTYACPYCFFYHRTKNLAGKIQANIPMLNRAEIKPGRLRNTHDRDVAIKRAKRRRKSRGKKVKSKRKSRLYVLQAQNQPLVPTRVIEKAKRRSSSLMGDIYAR